MFGFSIKKKTVVATPATASVDASEARAREAGSAAAMLRRIVRLSDEAAGTVAALDAAVFRDLVEAHVDARRAALQAEAVARDEARRACVKRMCDEHIDEATWRGRLEQALEAAARGEKEHLLLRFPSELCEDGGRMINAPDPAWPTSLRGPAAEVHARWLDELKPRGFGLVARILEFPDGFPGDAGLFLTW